MSAVTVAFMGALIYGRQWLLPLLDEHLDDLEGEVLPHLLIADVERWAEAEVLAQRTGSGTQLAAVLDFIEEQFASMGDTEVGELISVSFLEHLPRLGEPASELRSLVGPTCATELDAIG